MTPRKPLIRAAFALAALALAAAQPALASDIYKGKTVTYIVATAAGGGYDGYGRLITRYMEKNLPGSTFVVVNRPGAGHIIGTNLIYAAKPDGLTIGTFNTGVIYSQIVGLKQARYDLGKMSWIGKAAAAKRTIVIDARRPYRTFLDFAKSDEPVRMAVSGVGSAAYTELQLLAKVFDLKIQLMPGYSGSEDEMAMMRGEVVGKMGSMSSQWPFVRDGRGRYVLQVGGERDARYPEMAFGPNIAKTPAQKAVIKLMASQADMFRVTAGPPKIRADRLAALREAYGKALNDPKLRADAAKLQWDITPVVGDAVGQSIREALEQPPEIVAMLEALQKKKPKGVTVEGKLTAVQRGGRKILFKTTAGADDSASISGSRTKVEIGGQAAKRSALKPGMACAVTYVRPGSEAMKVSCK